MNDAQLFRWLEKHPQRITYAQGYCGAKSQWFFNVGGVPRKATSLRAAILRAVRADERFEARMKRLGLRD